MKIWLITLFVASLSFGGNIQIKKIKASQINFTHQIVNGYSICSLVTDKYQVKMRESSQKACNQFQIALSSVNESQDVVLVTDTLRKEIIHLTTDNTIERIN